MVRLIPLCDYEQVRTMRKHARHFSLERLVLSLILLIANVAAPFRTPAGRCFLDLIEPHDATESPFRSWASSELQSSHCFRVVVSLTRGTRAEAPARSSCEREIISRPLVVAREDSSLQSVPALLRPPLRC